MKRGVLITSLDFELFWGMQDGWKLEEYEKNVLGGRRAISEMLNLFVSYGIHATWATVGFMFADNYEELKKYFPSKSKRPSYKKKELSSYRCFSTIGKDEKQASCFYGSSLIKKISKVPGQEIGSHTFSHYYCREQGQTVEQFEADMLAAKAIARDKGYEIKSVVLPRNQSKTEYIKILKKLGFICYRGEEDDWIHTKIKTKKMLRGLRLVDVYLPLTGYGGYIPENEDGIWNLVGSRMYKPFFKPLGFAEKIKMHRIKRQMLHAAKNGLTFHLWWHPHNVGVKTKYHLKQLEEIFTYYNYLKCKYGMRSLNMSEMVDELEKNRS